MPEPQVPADVFGAGWSSPVARQAHNLKVAGSNPAPATKQTPLLNRNFYQILRLKIPETPF